jgi:tetratricopeptide (TPR) repeat protein
MSEYTKVEDSCLILLGHRDPYVDPLGTPDSNDVSLLDIRSVVRRRAGEEEHRVEVLRLAGACGFAADRANPPLQRPTGLSRVRLAAILQWEAIRPDRAPAKDNRVARQVRTGGYMLEAFPDRQKRLFGRAKDIRQLTDRARKTGLTALTARPLMGKSWVMTEVARILSEEGRAIVGYHESKGAESSHLLYAVSNLYCRWLEESSMREQAMSLWERHKDDLVPQVGKMVGLLFEKLAGKQLHDGVGAVVRAAFDGLAEAQKDLLSGGLQLTPIPYDQALSLMQLVAKITQRRIVLVLDAWEKSPSLNSDFATLESFLKHLDGWPETHIFLVVKNLEIDSRKLNDEGYQRARDLCRGSAAAHLYELSVMNQADEAERKRIVAYVKSKIAVTEAATDDFILNLVDGYPGVIDFWTNDNGSRSVTTLEDLKRLAFDAQALRYIDLEHVLGELSDELKTIAVHFAFLPRLDQSRWMLLSKSVLGHCTQTALDTLVDGKLFVDEPYPTFGHDTRHVAAQRWFVEKNRRLLCRVAEALVRNLAGRISGAEDLHRPFAETLAGCEEISTQLQLSPISRCLISAARAALGDPEDVSGDAFDESYRDAVIENPGVVVLVAMALMNRGCLQYLRRYEEKASEYFSAILSFDTLSDTLKATAYSNLAFLESERQNQDLAASYLGMAINLVGAAAETRARAYVTRGAIAAGSGSNQEAISDFNTALQIADCPDVVREIALINRGICYVNLRRPLQAIADFTAASELPQRTVPGTAKALINRAALKSKDGDIEGAIADYERTLKLPGVSMEQTARAIYNRAVAKREKGDFEGEMSDYMSVILMDNDAPPRILAKALLNRAIAVGEKGDILGEVVDCLAVIKLQNAPPDIVESARSQLAYRRFKG